MLGSGNAANMTLSSSSVALDAITEGFEAPPPKSSMHDMYDYSEDEDDDIPVPRPRSAYKPDTHGTRQAQEHARKPAQIGRDKFNDLWYEHSDDLADRYICHYGIQDFFEALTAELYALQPEDPVAFIEQYLVDIVGMAAN